MSCADQHLRRRPLTVMVTRRNHIVALVHSLGVFVVLSKGQRRNKCRLDRHEFVGVPSGGALDLDDH